MINTLRCSLAQEHSKFYFPLLVLSATQFLHFLLREKFTCNMRIVLVEHAILIFASHTM